MLLILVSFISCTQKQFVVSNATVQFQDSIYDFKKISKTGNVKTVFKFSNVGESQLIIYDVKTSCGCTKPEWSMNPIEPNGNGIIKVMFDAKGRGLFNKTLSVFYNGKDSPKKLIIKGEIL